MYFSKLLLFFRCSTRHFLIFFHWPFLCFLSLHLCCCFRLFSGRFCCSRLPILCRTVLLAELFRPLFQLLFAVCRKHTSSISILQICTTYFTLYRQRSFPPPMHAYLSLFLMHTLIRHATYRFPRGLLRDNLRPAIFGQRSHHLYISASTKGRRIQSGLLPNPPTRI